MCAKNSGLRGLVLVVVMWVGFVQMVCGLDGVLVVAGWVWWVLCKWFAGWVCGQVVLSWVCWVLC